MCCGDLKKSFRAKADKTNVEVTASTSGAEQSQQTKKPDSTFTEKRNEVKAPEQAQKRAKFKVVNSDKNKSWKRQKKPR